MTIDQIRSIASKLPHVTEDIKWGADLCFCIAKKMFCVTSLEGPVKVALKVTDEEFEELTDKEGIIPAPYMARNKWVMVSNESRLPARELQRLIKQSYEIIKSKLPKKLQRSLS